MALYRNIVDVVNQNDIYLIDLTSSLTYEYVGYSQPGTATSASSWKIIRITLDSNGRDIAKTFANGSLAYAAVWDNRTTYSYS